MYSIKVNRKGETVTSIEELFEVAQHCLQHFSTLMKILTTERLPGPGFSTLSACQDQACLGCSTLYATFAVVIYLCCAVL